jgi:hypothetical protein
MKDTIYTIPLTDAFHANDECPFCYIERKLEQDAIAFTLGSSYMQDDFRAITDEMGFCRGHYKKLYDYGNKLGMALILHTHYKSLYTKLEEHLAHNTLPTLSFIQKIKQKNKRSKDDNASSMLSSFLHETEEKCFVCDRVEKNMERYMHTFFYLLTTQQDFKKLFSNSKGFCLHHFTLLVDLAPITLNKEQSDLFFEESKKMLLENLKRVEDDLSWFIDKYDYKNSNEPWKNAKDAIPRGIQKLAGIYPQDPPFKED